MTAGTKKIAIVAALEREVAVLVKGWRRQQVTAQNRTIQIFENNDASVIVACGGIGTMSARVATEAAYQHAKGEIWLFISAGFAGALKPSLKVGDIVQPREVISEADGQRISTATGTSVLVSAGAVASKPVKKRFAEMYGADAVDMEAYSVGDVASIYKVPFIAIKAVSDELDFDMPPLGRFVNATGQFSTAGFVTYTVIRPWVWPAVVQLGKNAALASQKLTAALNQTIDKYAAEPDLYNMKQTQSH
jgi:nucleoside phosphorylase